MGMNSRLTFFEYSHCFLWKICSHLYLYFSVMCWVYFLSMLYDFLFVISFKEHNFKVPWYIIYVSCVWSSVTFLDMLDYGFPSNWAIDQPLFLQISLCFPLSSPVGWQLPSFYNQPHFSHKESKVQRIKSFTQIILTGKWRSKK